MNATARLQATRPRAARAATAPLLAQPWNPLARPALQQKQMRRAAAAAPARRTAPLAVRAAATTADAGGNLDVQGDMLAPSAANNNVVRLMAASVAVLAMARATGYLSGTGATAVHLVAFAAWLGSTIWVTFVGGITMFKNMPRQMFGRVQAKLFPQYFALHAASIVVIMGTLAFGAGSAGLARPQAITLGVSLAASLANLVVLEPMTTEVMFARYDLENAATRDEGAIKALYKKFGMLHGLGSLVNLGAMVGAVAHGWWLASRLTLA